jgi:hypothetical protein
MEEAMTSTPQAIVTLVNEEDGVEARVFSNTRGGFNVVLRDSDSGHTIAVTVVPELEHAIALAHQQLGVEGGAAPRQAGARLSNPTQQLALVVGDAHGLVSGKEISGSADADASGLVIKGDEVTFFPDFQRAKAAAEARAKELEADGWKPVGLTPTALDFVVVVMRGDARSKVADSIAKSLGEAAPIVCPKEFVVVHDVSGKQRRSCDFYICRQTSLPSGNSAGRHAAQEAVVAAKKWFGADEPTRGRGVELPDPPWQRGPQIDEIWYRRHAVEGLSGRYEHPYKPSVPLYVSSQARDGWRIALPDGCIVDHRGFVYP